MQLESDEKKSNLLQLSLIFLYLIKTAPRNIRYRQVSYVRKNAKRRRGQYCL